MIDLEVLAKTFLAVFIAELGDKTQLATLGFSAESSSRWSVFIGAAAALVTTSLIAVLAGGQVARFVSAQTLQRAAGVLFIVLGVYNLWR